MTADTRRRTLLALNGGSSSIRFSLYEEAEPLLRLSHGKVDRDGLGGSEVVALLNRLASQPGFDSLKAVGTGSCMGWRIPPQSGSRWSFSMNCAAAFRMTPSIFLLSSS